MFLLGPAMTAVSEGVAAYAFLFISQSLGRVHTFIPGGNFLHLGFEEYFQSHDHLQLLLSRQIHIPKLSLTQWPPNIKVL